MQSVKEEVVLYNPVGLELSAEPVQAINIAEAKGKQERQESGMSRCVGDINHKFAPTRPSTARPVRAGCTATSQTAKRLSLRRVQLEQVSLQTFSQMQIMHKVRPAAPASLSGSGKTAAQPPPTIDGLPFQEVTASSINATIHREKAGGPVRDLVFNRPALTVIDLRLCFQDKVA